jgi:hypothetical protein
MPRIGAGRPDDLDDEAFPEIALVRDVLVIPSPGHQADPQDWLDNPPVEEAVDLGNGVFLERLRGDDADLAEQVIEASTPRGLNHDAYRQFGQLYSFWREIPAAEWDGQGMFNWDPSQALAEVIALSRFVRDNAHSFEFAGRVFDRTDGHRRIAPLTGHDGRMAYRSRKDRFWLTTTEADTLRVLLDQYRAVKDTLPDRVKRALWQADLSAYSRYIDEAATRIVTGLEALLNTGDDEPIAAQFVKRSQALATELGIETNRRYWSWVYDVRSRVIHGDESKLIAPVGWDETESEPPPDVAKIATAQEVLRKAVSKAVEDDDFRAVFASAETVRARFPLEAAG